MYYYRSIKDSEGIWLVEDNYDWNYSRKSESVFTIANGYLGIRGSQDFKGLVESRGMFVNGFFQKAAPNEVTELINCPDLTVTELIADGEMVSMDTAQVEEYDRRYNVETAELRLKAVLRLKSGNRISIYSRRFASLDMKHLFCQELTVTPLDKNIEKLKIKAGINGQITNSGAAHIRETECRVLEKAYLHFIGRTDSAAIDIFEKIDIDVPGEMEANFGLERRSIYKKATCSLKAGQSLVITKKASVFKSGDADAKKVSDIEKELRATCKISFGDIFEAHKAKADEFWKYASIEIDGITLEDMAAIKYAQMQLFGMTPTDGGKSSIGAKGLSGEGYKGHVFWDTEMYMLPFYIFTFPEKAKDLLIYRYRGLEGAREKAADYGYKGAMYPWESAADGREETPLFAALNIHTGKANPVWSGRKEHHVSADIAYAIIKYYQTTGDWDFMLKYGIEMLVGISEFWVSRATLRDGQLVILDTIGPDEYTEHIDNNAFTNYMAKHVIEHTLGFMSKAEAEGCKIKGYAGCFSDLRASFQEFCDKIYLPQPGDDRIIPQDDTFLSKPELPDIDIFRNAPEKQAVLLKYSRDEVVGMQALKQADVVMLLNVFPGLFDEETVKANVRYYESRTLHDSSLSYCAHAQACACIGALDMSTDFFRKALEIDLCDNPMDSTDGLHAASLGGIWNCIIMGYAGLAAGDDGIEVTPHLPEEWKSITFCICRNGKYYKVKVKTDGVEMEEL